MPPHAESKHSMTKQQNGKRRVALELPEELLAFLKEKAAQAYRSVPAEICMRLEQSRNQLKEQQS